MPVDRVFRSGETFDWEGYHFTLDWMPGQTEFGCCLQGRIDGRLVAFTGDNLFGNPADPEQTGHEAVVARNSAIFEEGYIYAGEYLRRLQPDLLVGGHSYVMDRPHDFIERFARWSVEMRDAYRELSAEDDYRLMFDPYWVRADPYRVTLKPGETVEVTVRVRNFHGRPQSHRIALHAPAGVTADPPVLEAVVAPESTAGFPVKLTASPDAPKGVQIVAFDITLDGRRYGEWFDFVVLVQ